MLFFVVVFLLFFLFVCFLLFVCLFVVVFLFCFLLLFIFCGGGIVFSLFLYHFTILTVWGMFSCSFGLFFFNIMAALCLRIVSK